MSVLALDAHHPKALADALAQRGYPPSHAEAAAGGIRQVVLLADELDADARDLLVREASRVGAECVSGEGWVLLAASAAVLGALTRPDTMRLPAVFAEALAEALGGVLDPPRAWRMARGTIALDRPVVVGVLNITPDSFSDGGNYLDSAAALHHAEAMLAAGAGMLDVGAESTRPGRREPVTEGEEWRRLAPVVEALASRFPDVPVSVDTVKAVTARRALAAGAWAVNDVSGLRLDPELAEVCAEHDAGLILMHSRGALAELAGYRHAVYGHVTAEIVGELRAAVRAAESRGVRRERLALDPGLGFAKTPPQNLQVLRDLPALVGLGLPVMVGPSRKRFLGEVTGRDVAERDPATAAACVSAYFGGATLFRVHAVEPARDALAVAHAVRSA